MDRLDPFALGWIRRLGYTEGLVRKWQRGRRSLHAKKHRPSSHLSSGFLFNKLVGARTSGVQHIATQAAAAPKTVRDRSAAKRTVI